MRCSHAWQLIPVTRSSTCSMSFAPSGLVSGPSSAPATCGRMDVRTHRSTRRWSTLPCAQTLVDASPNLEEIVQLAIQLGGLVAQETMHVRARWPAALADDDDVLDLGQREAQAARLLDEAQHVDGVQIVEPVAVGRAPRRRKDSLPLVE